MGRLDQLGGAVRRVIGDLANDRSVYRKVADITDPRQAFPGRDMLEAYPGFEPPPVGSEVGRLHPLALIREAVYPAGLQDEAMGRLADNPLQTHRSGIVPLLVRPTAAIDARDTKGLRVSAYSDDGRRLRQAIDVAGGYEFPLRTLIHEARHATEVPGAEYLDSVRSVASRNPVVGSKVLTDRARRYYSTPSEMLAYLSEAGDDFVRAEGRLVRTERDAREVMGRVAGGEALTRASPLVRKLYADAYAKSPDARSFINQILTRYYAVPVTVGAGAASMGGEE